ncbi:MAG: hypothetical protein AAGE59_04810 [Cyanobacteria bacterium P01_F01_bin.86]
MADPILLAQARRGEVGAIAALLGKSLQPQGIWARAESQEGTIRIILESTQPPHPDLMEQRVRAGLERLQPQGITELILCGWALGDLQPAWERRIVLASDQPLIQSSERVSQLPPQPQPQLQPQPQPQSEPHQPPANRYPKPSQVQAMNPGGVRRSPQRRSAKQPFVLKWSDFDPVMFVIIGLVAVYGFFGSMNPSYDGPFIWLHYPDLAIHETGHLLFMPFGRFLMLLGGSLTQIAFPAVFASYFFISRQYFSSALTLFWTGQNFMDVGVYMRDAPVRLLPLTVDSVDAHDWWQLFRMMRCLQHAELIANLTHTLGVLVYLASVAAGIYFAYKGNRFSGENSLLR